MQSLEIRKKAAGQGLQPADRSDMSHVTRMGPNPDLTQILSGLVLLETPHEGPGERSDVAQIRCRFQ